ncbi:MAG: bacillithiol biosynthesis BshC [Candidatus Bathyarchaeia archaeon]
MCPDRDLLPPHRLYRDFVETGGHRGTVEELWGRVPVNLGEAHRLAAAVRGRYGAAPEVVEELKKALKRQLRRWGILTSRVEENIDRLDQGVVEAGQQPVCLGGPSLILNKVACAWSICEIGGEGGYVPLFYVADYDGVHNELLNIRVPSPSPRGLLVTLPAGAEAVGSPVYELPNPPEAWFKRTIERIRGNYKGLLKGADPHVRERKLQNLDHALTVLKSGYYSSDNVSEWSTKVLGSLINVEADLGVPILAFSMEEARPLFQSGYELLLSEPNRSRFIEASNRAAEILVGAGYRPQVGLRRGDYVPFFLECMNDPCRRRRVELRYRREAGASTAHVVGKCPSCGEEYRFSFAARHPDLSEVVDLISPRVDSRQVMVDSVVPVVCHIGGPGETGYYAEVAPGARGIGVPFPVFVRYTRVFYNTPWNEEYSDRLKDEGLPTLINDGLFSALSRWVEARNAGDAAGLVEAHSEIRRNIESTYDRLLERSRALGAEVSAIKRRLGEPGDRAALIGELRRKQGRSQAINVYLSSAFGRFSPERFGQEVSWSWLDLATSSGVDDLLGVFLRQYNEYTPVSSMFFVNL